MKSMKKVCPCNHHKLIPIIMVLFAILFLLGNMGYISALTVQMGWPILVGLAGVSKLSESECGCC